jgi:hypothetical protein
MVRAAKVRVSTWSQPHELCLPVSREALLVIGGRSFAGLPCPSLGAVSLILAWIPPCRRVWRYWRDSPHWRAKRAVGSPLATLRSSTRVAGRCRGLATTVPVSRVSRSAGPTATGWEMRVITDEAPLGCPPSGQVSSFG